MIRGTEIIILFSVHLFRSTPASGHPMGRCTVGDQSVFRHWRIFGYLRHFHPVFVTGSCRSFVEIQGAKALKSFYTWEPSGISHCCDLKVSTRVMAEIQGSRQTNMTEPLQTQTVVVIRWNSASLSSYSFIRVSEQNDTFSRHIPLVSQPAKGFASTSL